MQKTIVAIDTEYMRQEAEKCEDLDDVVQFFDKYSDYYVDWKSYINSLIKKYDKASVGKFANRCGFSVNTVKKWCINGDMPRSRKEFIKLALGLNFNIDETNKLLQRFGKYHKLYPKNIEDAICIFSVSNKLSFDEYEDLKKEFINIYTATIDKLINDDPNVYDSRTETIQSNLLDIKIKTDLEKYISEYYPIFTDAYKKLINFIDAYIKINSLDLVTSQNDSVNAFLESHIDSAGLVSVYNDMVSELRRHKSIPEKKKLIAFGLHLNMTLDDFNYMLGLAGMEPLCAKDKLESVLIYALNNIVLNNPGMELSNAMLLEKYAADAEIQGRCIEIINDYYRLELNDVIEFDSSDDLKRRGVPDSDELMEYIKTQIRQLDISDSNDFFRFLNME